VTASDCHPLTADFLKENLRLNHLPPMKYRHGNWSIPELEDALEDEAGRRIVDGRFDLIMGSDLLYERDANATLAAFIGLHASPAAEVWIGRPGPGKSRRLQPANGRSRFPDARGTAWIASPPTTPPPIKAGLLIYRFNDA